MTIKELSQLYYMKQELTRYQQRLNALWSLVTSPRVVGLNGMPNGGGCDRRLEVYMADISAIEEIILRQIRSIYSEQAKLEQFIATIPDSLTRQIFALRFVDGLNWWKVAQALGGGNTADGARKRAYRYLKMHNKENAEK